MGFLDQAKSALGKAEALAAEHADQLKGALEKVEGAANKATKGKYQGALSNASGKAGGYVDGLKPKQGPVAPAPTAAATEETPPPAQ